MTPEGEIKKAVKEMLQSLHILPKVEAIKYISDNPKLPLHGYYWMPASNGMGEAGVSDFCCCVYGLYIEIETKPEGGKQSGIQKKQQEIINTTMGRYYLIDSLNAVEFLEKELLASYKRYIIELKWQKNYLRSLN